MAAHDPSGWPVSRRLVVAALPVIGIAGCRQPSHAAAQIRPNLYACEGCEAVAERAPEALGWHVRLADASEPGQRMQIRGHVLSPDTGAPMSGVVIYAHHTNDRGLYADGSAESQWSRRHGRLRGWAKSDAEGRFRFDTIKPAPYPDRTMPAHVHLFIGEPGRAPYYVDDIVFDGEFGVTATYRRRMELRGGNGIVRLRPMDDGVLLAERDIILERHPG